MPGKTLARTALSVLAAAALLTGCATGENDLSDPAGSSQTGHNQADVEFAQQMIPHHRQALDMAALVTGHTGNAALTDLAGRIQRAQGPEIDQLTGWLRDWGAAPAPSGMHEGMPMAGMMSEQEMTSLGAASGAEFDGQWLRMMIRHHQGALDMANTESRTGGDPEAKALAGRIIEGQQAEITEMRGMLGER